MYKILEAVVGSQAYGLATPESDRDLLGLFLEPTKNLVSLGWNDHKGSVTHTDPDWTYHELGKFMGLVLKGNPSVTELLFMEDYTVLEPVAQQVLRFREKFLSRKSIATAYIGYAKAQIKRYKDHTGRYNNEKAARKNARHTFRLMVQACELLSTGTMSVRLSTDAIDTCWWISDLCITDPEQFIQQTNLWLERTIKAENRSKLPLEPDYSFINTLLKNIRYSYYWSVPD